MVFRRILSIIAFFVGLYVFAVAFFPYKPLIPAPTESSAVAEPKFQKLVFMVIDALRYDFVFKRDTMSFTRSLLYDLRKAIGFIGMAAAPTVTMPRLKAMTSGTISNYLDIVFNLDTSSGSDTGKVLKQQDTWLLRFKQAGKRLAFYGDDTWLKLFGSNMFDQSEGTHSFYVRDTVEVDNNVTRHLPKVLKDQSSWDVLILHYLGLDHVGHSHGPQSEKIDGKLKEMDGIIQKIYDECNDCLLIIAGDHGMNEIGNHGGSSYLECATAMIFASKAFKIKESFEFTEADQISLVPTIAAAFGLRIPSNNVGVILTDVLKAFMDEKDINFWANETKNQLKETIAFQGLKHKGPDDMNALSNTLKLSVLNYDITQLLSGLVLMLCSLTSLMLLDYNHDILKPYIVPGLLYLFSMLSSSLVEEEHEIWFYFTSSLYLWNYLKSFNSFHIILLGINRVFYGWNQSGIRLASATDNVRSYLMAHPEMTTLNLGLFLVAVALPLVLYRKSLTGWPILVSLLQAVLVTYYKIIEQNNTVAQMLYIMIILTFVSRHRPLAATSIIYLSVLLSRTHNAILLPLLSFQTVLFTQTEEYPLSFLMMQVPLSFYVLGNSNSIATIDLQNAYVGLSKNHMELAGLVTFLSTFSGPLVVLCSFLFLSKQSLSLKHLQSWILWRLIVTFMVCFTCLIMKDHLFVWSVFSPRLLYEMAWIFFYATSFIVAYFLIEIK